MPATLHLSLNTSTSLVLEVIRALTGVNVTEQTREKSSRFRSALLKAATPGLEFKPTAVRHLINDGFEGLERNLPDGVTAQAYITAYIEKHHPDVKAYEDFTKNGLCEFKAADYTRANQLDVLHGAGSTANVQHLRALFAQHPAMERLPQMVRQKIPGLYWRAA